MVGKKQESCRSKERNEVFTFELDLGLSSQRRDHRRGTARYLPEKVLCINPDRLRGLPLSCGRGLGDEDMSNETLLLS